MCIRETKKKRIRNRMFRNFRNRQIGHPFLKQVKGTKVLNTVLTTLAKY